ncbi:hypothetical protein FA378_11170 [Pseudomonas aeruginosa]|nr:hypothetical protein [Pseudomonas aeruginosa]MCO2762387.1 hypothetical protein [Pseudomonas aeruginosa]MCO2768892.1 hypothetical protein [Pseudomonas aeruginosa]HBO5142824.1 hypothetical protein [Pseudomonas aeruginosa]
MDIQVQQRIYWSDLAESKLTRHSLDHLLDGQIPYIRIANFASREECEALVTSAVNEGFGPYRGVEPVINRIGNTVFEYNSISKHEYFEKNIDLNRVQQRIFDSSFNPLERIIGLLEQQAQRRAGVARNVEGQPYYAGLVRRIENGTLLHVDFAPGEQPGWEVAVVEEQLAWNLYLRVSDPYSGRTHIFDRQWQPADNALKEGIYGYNARVVAGIEDASFAPAVGEVVIFNTRNFHYVEPTAGERVSFTSAIGRLPSGDLVLWS